VVGNQIGSSTPGPSFGHNLCFRCLNDQCELILDIYTSRAFQWYKKRHQTLSLTLAIALWSFGSPPGLHLPKWELPWECECSLPHTPSHSLTLPGVCDVTPRDLLGPHPCNAFALTPELSLGSHPCKPFALVASPRLGLRHNLRVHTAGSDIRTTSVGTTARSRWLEWHNHGCRKVTGTISIAERRTTFAKAYGMKVRYYWEHIGNKRKNETKIFLNNLPSQVLRKAITYKHWFLPWSQCELGGKCNSLVGNIALN